MRSSLPFWEQMASVLGKHPQPDLRTLEFEAGELSAFWMVVPLVLGRQK